MLRNSKGFTLIELMIVVVIIGILAAIAIPNFISMQDRARESSVKANMHTAQLAMEDFAVQNDGVYATAGTDVTDVTGETVQELCPDDLWPDNPFTGATSAPSWGLTADGNEGEFSFETAATDNYIIDGAGKDGNLLALTLTNGS